MNRLEAETSPYLLQHADNPVDWQPWDDQALAAARSENKPILLSIGYSACHWCHVMAHESFEDDATAALLNEHFVNIKVDREERPDLDRVYQLAHQLLTRSTGGWPLTMFLDPATLLPFFGGTYFPKTPRFNLPGFSDLLRRISDTFQNQHNELEEQGNKLAEVFDQLAGASIAPEGVADEALLAAARDELAAQFDTQHGGFGSAPKFPMPSALDRLLRHWAHRNRHADGDREALDMAMRTLTRIARGGIYDHLGGGFYRYATDRQWVVPHFEKMLYDNGALLGLLADVLGLGPDVLFDAAVRETAAWLQREMQHPEGGFYAALDADSEGREGGFYVWRRDQVKRLLSEDEHLVVETLYGLDKPANFESRWILYRHDAWRSVVERLSLDGASANALLTSAKQKLFSARAERVPPAQDTKVLTAWNGLAIGGLAKAALRLGEPTWLNAAQRAADFVRSKLWDGERLLATWCDGVAKYPGYLDDYANMIEGLLELLAAEWRETDVEFATELAEALLSDFYDTEAGGFFFTRHEHETLIHRPKPTHDDALPPGNGTAARALRRLGHLLGDSRLLDAEAATVAWARGFIEQQPGAHCTILGSVEAGLYPPQQIILRGPADAFEPWLAVARDGYRPWRECYAIPYDGVGIVPAYLPKLVSADARRRVTGYVCSGLVCSAPLDDLEAFRAALEAF